MPGRASPSEALSTPVDGVEVLGALSPSRAGDFMTCPLLYRFRTVDRLPEPPSPDATRGTLVHQVLEDLFDLPAAERTPEQARDLLVPAWERLLEAEPELAEMFTAVEGPAPARGAGWRPAATSSTATSPSRTRACSSRPSASSTSRRCSTPGCCCAASSTGSTSPPTARIRVVDYKTGTAPARGFEAKALFQMKFYALVIWRTRGVVPAMLQLVYLGNGELLRYVPDEQDLLATERKVEAIWRGHPAGRPRPATGGPTDRGCATGAPTGRSAPSGAAPRRRCREALAPADPRRTLTAEDVD